MCSPGQNAAATKAVCQPFDMYNVHGLEPKDGYGAAVAPAAAGHQRVFVAIVGRGQVLGIWGFFL